MEIFKHTNNNYLIFEDPSLYPYPYAPLSLMGGFAKKTNTPIITIRNGGVTEENPGSSNSSIYKKKVKTFYQKEVLKFKKDIEELLDKSFDILVFLKKLKKKKYKSLRDSDKKRKFNLTSIVKLKARNSRIVKKSIMPLKSVLTKKDNSNSNNNNNNNNDNNNNNNNSVQSPRGSSQLPIPGLGLELECLRRNIIMEKKKKQE